MSQTIRAATEGTPEYAAEQRRDIVRDVLLLSAQAAGGALAGRLIGGNEVYAGMGAGIALIAMGAAPLYGDIEPPTAAKVAFAPATGAAALFDKLWPSRRPTVEP